jgi:hypothetical protein
VAVEAKGGRRPGPYVADTFPVRVEDTYVVVYTNSRPVADRQEVRDDEHVAG